VVGAKRAFGTHQGSLPQELALAGITDMAAANRYLQAVYLPAFNGEFAVSPMETGSAFVSWIGGSLDDVLCEQHKRIVGNDNCVRFETLIPQIPADGIVATTSRIEYAWAVIRLAQNVSGTLTQHSV